MQIPDLPDQTNKSDYYMSLVQGRVAQIDADFIAYQASAETKDELDGLVPRRSLDMMKYNVKASLEDTARMVGATSYVAHLTPAGSDKGGRTEQAMLKPYQANRKSKAKPEHLETIRQYIAEECNGMVHLHQEADDGMATANYDAEDRNLSVIVSRDKDLRMCEGLQWDFKEELVVDVEGYGDIWIDTSTKTKKVIGLGTAFFWAQLLMGDPADNISGLPTDPDGKKVGPMAAYEYLKYCTDDYQCFQVVKYLYANSTTDYVNHRNGSEVRWQHALLSEMKLLWMRRATDDNDVLTFLMEISR